MCREVDKIYNLHAISANGGNFMNPALDASIDWKARHGNAMVCRLSRSTIFAIHKTLN